MSRVTLDTKCRLCRAEGVKLYLKNERCLSPKCPIEKKGGILPGMHGAKRAKKPTDYGIQLRAKQKAKRIYGVQERQFKNYYLKAKTMLGLVGENLLSLLERRLDNILYVTGLASSRSQAKQLVSHKHVRVNDKVNNVPSLSLKIGDTIMVDDKMVKLKEATVPAWLQLDKSSNLVKVIALPTRDDITKEIDENLIIEYYSR
jgi:small subunit ribosomal protein S4